MWCSCQGRLQPTPDTSFSASLHSALHLTISHNCPDQLKSTLKPLHPVLYIFAKYCLAYRAGIYHIKLVCQFVTYRLSNRWDPWFSIRWQVYLVLVVHEYSSASLEKFFQVSHFFDFCIWHNWLGPDRPKPTKALKPLHAVNVRKKDMWQCHIMALGLRIGKINFRVWGKNSE